MEVSRKTIAKYLGYRGQSLDGPTDELVTRALAELESVTPRHVLARFSLALHGDTAQVGNITFESASLAGHLAGCHEAVLLASTLGVQADQMIRRASLSHMSRAVVLQACAAAKLEGYLNVTCAALAQELKKEGMYLTPRFSPGYGDLSLDCQQELLDILEAGKHIGLSLTTGKMLAPTKSVTAVIGISPERQSACIQTCARCPNTACPFREE
jgi:hypothetical protein